MPVDSFRLPHASLLPLVRQLGGGGGWASPSPSGARLAEYASGVRVKVVQVQSLSSIVLCCVTMRKGKISIFGEYFIFDVQKQTFLQ